MGALGIGTIFALKRGAKRVGVPRAAVIGTRAQ
jgi:hypothetical protein